MLFIPKNSKIIGKNIKEKITVSETLSEYLDINKWCK